MSKAKPIGDTKRAAEILERFKSATNYRWLRIAFEDAQDYEWTPRQLEEINEAFDERLRELRVGPPSSDR
jgi:hypothetical protein